MFEVSALKAFSDNYIWTLVKGNEVTVVDPGDPEPVIKYLDKKGLTLKNILITHHHFDHTGGIEKWIHGWKKNGWKTSAKKPVKNQELWMKIDTLNHFHEVQWKWVKGHSGHRENEIADLLANKGIDEL